MGPSRTPAVPLLEVMVELVPPDRIVVLHVMAARQRWTLLRSGGEHSPAVRFAGPKALNDDVDQLAATQGRTAAEVMRDAIADYLTRNKTR